jgi:hypothetical protein
MKYRPVDDTLDKWLADIGLRLSEQWGLHIDQRVSRHDVDALATLCAVDVNLWNRTEQFCSLFTRAELELWEFTRDMYLTNTIADDAPAHVREKMLPLLSTIVLRHDTMQPAAAKINPNDPASAVRIAHKPLVNIRVLRANHLISMLALLVCGTICYHTSTINQILTHTHTHTHNLSLSLSLCFRAFNVILIWVVNGLDIKFTNELGVHHA